MASRSKLSLIAWTLPAVVLGTLVTTPLWAQDMGETALQQMTDIVAAKSRLTATQKKMDSALVFAAMAARNDASIASFANTIPVLGANDVASASEPDAATNSLDADVAVDISAQVSAALLQEITAAGGRIDAQSAQWGLIHARIPLGSLETIAANAAVNSIQLAARGATNVGALTSQGYIAHAAKTVVNQGYDGTGVTVGVLSDSASAARIATLVASGDLPPDTIALPGRAGPVTGIDEGTAMMEIIHDVAPGAKLIFATALPNIVTFANSIIALQQAGAKVIVDDFTFFAEGAFQDGPIARAVNRVTAAGVIYISSAANSGNITFGTAGTWEGDFQANGPAMGPTALFRGGLVHNFGTAANPQNFDVLTGLSTFISLKWSDPLTRSTNDYDLFILDSTGTTLKGFSVGSQTGLQDPFEAIQQGMNCGTAAARGYCPAIGDRLVVVLFSGQQRAIRIDTHRGRLSIATAGSTFGHNAGLNTISTAATYWASARSGTRPFTGAANPIETFSSDGPRKIFYDPDGQALTPGNVLFSTGGGVTLQKPDLTAADGVSTKTPRFMPFFGTSAAAPHVAGIAALVLQAAPNATVEQVKAALRGGTVDNMAPGVDRDSGTGIVMAPLAVDYVQSH